MWCTTLTNTVTVMCAWACAYSDLGWMMEFYILAIPKVMSRLWQYALMTISSATPLKNHATGSGSGSMTRYPLNHIIRTELTSSCPLILMLSARLGSDRYQFYTICITQPANELPHTRLMLYQFSHCAWNGNCVTSIRHMQTQEAANNSLDIERQSLLFYILATYKAISGRFTTCDCVHSWRLYSAVLMGDQTAITDIISIPVTVTLPWHWANQSLPYPNNGKCLDRKQQVSII